MTRTVNLTEIDDPIAAAEAIAAAEQQERPELVTVAEAAKWLGITPETMLHWSMGRGERPRLCGLDLEGKRAFRFRREQLRPFVEAAYRPPALKKRVWPSRTGA